MQILLGCSSMLSRNNIARNVRSNNPRESYICLTHLSTSRHAALSLDWVIWWGLHAARWFLVSLEREFVWGLRTVDQKGPTTAHSLTYYVKKATWADIIVRNGLGGSGSMRIRRTKQMRRLGRESFSQTIQLLKWSLIDFVLFSTIVHWYP